VPQAGDQGADLLPLREQVRRHGRERRAEAVGLEDENRRLKTLVADLTLDNQMLKAAVQRKW